MLRPTCLLLVLLPLLLLLLSPHAAAFPGPEPEGPDAAEDPLPPEEQPAISDATDDDTGNAVYAPRVVVSSVLGFLGAIIVVATTFFIYKKANHKPLDYVNIAAFFRRSSNSNDPQARSRTEHTQIVTQPPPVATQDALP